MLTHRIARHAASQGVLLPALEPPFHVGLAGSLRIDGEIPLVLTNSARNALYASGAVLDQLLNEAGQVLTAVQLKDTRGAPPLEPLLAGEALPDGYALLLTAAGWRFIVLPAEGCLRVVNAVQGDPAPPAFALLLISRFRVGPVSSFDPLPVFRQIAGQLQLRRMLPEVSAEHEADRAFLLRYRRYLEAVRDNARQERPEVSYELVSRVPIRLAIVGERWPAAFTRPRVQIELPTYGGQSRRVDVSGLDDDQSTLIVDDADADEMILEQGVARVADPTAPLRRMLESLQALAEGHREEYLRLLDVIRRAEKLGHVSRSGAMFPRIGAPSAENRRQHEAVAMALACPDLCLVHGPPGTGKTTVICELIRQLVANGQRILLVAPTNVALDNVLERIGHERGIFALRLGHLDKVDERLVHYLVHLREASLRAQLIAGLGEALQDADPRDAVVQVQQAFRDEIEHTRGLGDLLLLNANLICATPIGIAMTPAFRTPEPIFDVMIMDEAGKATLTEFLVPATRAKRWVLVGDERQLPPYVDLDELTAITRVRVKRSEGDQDTFEAFDEERLQYLAGMLRRHFDERMHPDESRRIRVWGGLLAAVFDEDDEGVDALCRIPPHIDRWREIGRQYAETGMLPEELAGVELVAPGAFALRARLLAELLEMQEVAMTGAFEFLRSLPASRVVGLNHQYRMRPELAAFSARCVYPQGYHSAESTHALHLPIPTLEKPSIWIDTALQPLAERYEYPRDREWQGGDYHNLLEVDVVREVIEHCIAWAEQGWRIDARGRERAFEIGVVSFYFEQARRLRDALGSLLEPERGDGPSRWRLRAPRPAANGAAIEIHVSVVDRFQGQEKDVMIISGTRSNPKRLRGHVNNLNRLNVAATRARYKRIFVGDASTLVRQGDDPQARMDLLTELFRDSEHKQIWGRRLSRPSRGAQR
ncbi:AAA domain-containing protein [Sorangium sp. So ce385]|uniref:AAA domain-containing protein n=1 Tax=Sorangium sp. So ce385 TaxID=3133308 RepID=UPI003F5B13F1